MLKSNSIIHKFNLSGNHLILLIILIIGSILRLYNISSLPFSHDELSALLRTEYTSFHELIEQGVKTDYHPAGIQVFLYYWVSLFGKAEWIVKLPFILASISSIYLMFQIGKKWKNETVGLICAAFIASTQYSVMYGTTARPYASGLFFILLLVNVFLTIRNDKDLGNQLKNWILFVLAGTCAAYNHHYSLLIAGILGVTGIFFIPKKFIRYYLLSGAVIVILYIPHIPILLHQLSKGGVGGADGWLAAPTPYFFIDYFSYLFHFSIWPVIVTLGIIIYGFFNSDISRKTIGLMFLALNLLFIPILIGYFYSRLENPILQFSILIFCHFFLYLFLFGHLKKLTVFKNALLVGSVLLVNITTLIVNRQHYTVNYNSIYEHVTLDLTEARSENPQMPGMIDCSPSILGFYDKQKINPPKYLKYRDFDSTKERLAYLDSISGLSDYFYFGGTSFVDPNFIALIQTKFPYIIWQKNYFTGSTYLFSKKIDKTNNKIVTNYSTGNWSDGSNKLSVSDDGYFQLDSLIEFSPAFKVKAQDILTKRSNAIDILVEYKSLPSNSDVKIIAQLELPDTVLQWNASSSNDQEIGNKCSKQVHTFSLHNPRDYKNSTIKLFLWNPKKLKVEFKDIIVSERKGNPILYGLFEAIE